MALAGDRPGCCGACGFGNDPAARFCNQCGARLASPATAGPTATAHPVTGERRQLTAMFCDLVGYMRLSERVDPEELREILVEYQRVCSTAIGGFDGHIAQFLGDGVLAYFGYPRAYEDDAARAVRAALAIQSALADLSTRRTEAGAEAISARVGIHTGVVVVAEMGDAAHQETLALGDAIGVASRLQALAEPGGVVISQTTLRLVSGLFVTRDLGAPGLKGVTEPIRVHAVSGSAGVLSHRFAVSGALTPLTGRERERERIRRCWQQAERGRGRLVAISGEAGIGKSRLVHALLEELAETPHFTLELGCSPYSSGSAFQPVVDILERGLGFAAEDGPEDRLAKLEDRLAQLPGMPLEEVVPYLAPLLALPPSRRFRLEHMTPELQREKTLQALVAPILALAARSPLLVVCEDLHWCDPSSLELLGRLIQRSPELPMLLVVTFRPDFEPPWRLPGSRVTALALSRLPKRSTRAIIEAAAGGAVAFPKQVIERLVESADGVPLFAEELARSVVEAGLVEQRDGRREFRGRIEDLHIPLTLRDSLEARLDRLSSARRVAQLAATLGRDFSYGLIEAVGDTEIPGLRDGLEQLVRAGILLQHGEPPEATYHFKHVLLQDTAYESQLKSRRRALHARIATILEERFPRRAEAEPDGMARHCAEGGRILQAVKYYKLAGERTVARLANAEAVEYFDKALELLAALPEDGERRAVEIELRLARGLPLAALRGYDDPEAVASCERTEALCESLGSGPQQLPALVGLTLYHMNRGHLPRARQYADALLRVAEPLGVAGLRVAGHMIRGTASMTSATVPEACRDLEAAIEIASTADLPPPRAAFDMDALTLAHSIHAIALVNAGRPESAMRASERALRRARELGHTRTSASALVNSSTAARFLEDAERTRELTEECLKLIDGRGFHSIECTARVHAGWARTLQGDASGVEAIAEGLDRASAVGALGGLCQLYCTAGETYALAGRFDRAFEALDRATQVMERTGERSGYAPQLLTLRARLLIESGARELAEAERLLLASLDGWQQSGSRWLELLSAVLLARIAPKIGRTEEARERLDGLYATFQEGFEHPRLREARTLIDGLAG